VKTYFTVKMYNI